MSLTEENARIFFHNVRRENAELRNKKTPFPAIKAGGSRPPVLCKLQRNFAKQNCPAPNAQLYTSSK